MSSSPVVDSSGVVYVGSADGSVYSFNPTTGAQNWRVVLNTAAVEPVEASIAIGQNGILYVGTRVNTNTLDGGTMYAINPVTHTKVWTQPLGNAVGFIASPVIDQASHFNHTVSKLNPGDGTPALSWTLPGKVCQTPAINQNGLLILGVSAMSVGEINEVAAIKIADPGLSTEFWAITQAGGQALGNTLGSPAIICDNGGSTYVADMLGKVIRFFSGGPMMAGQWPTFECGNRRAGKTFTYPSAISVLPPFYNNLGYDLSQVNSVNVFGQAFGQSYGSYSIDPPGYAAAYWANNTIYTPGDPSYALNAFATAGNGAGDVVGYLSAPLAWPDGVNAANSAAITLATPGFSGGYAYDINSDSTIIGWGTGGGIVHVFRWEKSGSSWLAPIDLNLNSPSYFQCYAYSITDNGRIAGQARFTSGGPFHAFNTGQYPNDLTFQAIDLGTMGGTASEARDMHELKGTVGRSQLSTGYWRAFYLPISAPNLGNSAIYEICGLPINRTDWSSAAYSVNKLGQVVGYAQIEQGQNLVNRAVLYDDRTGITTDLNDFALDG